MKDFVEEKYSEMFEQLYAITIGIGKKTESTKNIENMYDDNKDCVKLLDNIDSICDKFKTDENDNDTDRALESLQVSYESLMRKISRKIFDYGISIGIAQQNKVKKIYTL